MTHCNSSDVGMPYSTVDCATVQSSATYNQVLIVKQSNPTYSIKIYTAFNLATWLRKVYELKISKFGFSTKIGI